MQTNVLERIRALEADIEKCIDSVVQQGLFAKSITNARHRILLDHFTIHQAELVRGTAEKLLDAYLDEDDIEEVQNAPCDTPDDVAAAVKEFEAKIADIREYHHTYRNLPSIKHDLSTPDPKMLDEIFTLQERHGATFDVDAHYSRYSAFMVHTRTLAEACEGDTVSPELTSELQPVTPSSVRTWCALWPGRLDFFRFTKAIPQILLHETEAHRKVLAFALYKPFVEELLRYLIDFYRRVHPLETETLDRLLTQVESDGEEYWAALLTAKAEVTSVAAAATGASSEPAPEASDEEAQAGDEDAEDAAARKHAKVSTARVAVENKISCGLTIPPSLRRHAKRFSLWPVTTLEKLARELPATVAGDQNLTDKESDAGGSSAKRHGNFPLSLHEVKELCLAEAKAAELLQSLLYSTLENTDKTLLRDYSRTTDELESDRAQAEEEFLASLDEVRRNSASTMEGTVAHAAAYNLKLALKGSAGLSALPLSSNAFIWPGFGRAAGPVLPAAPDAPPDKEEVEQEEMLGENGEPIPRWLQQLHQLDKVFKCDVCGGTVYKGPKVFREHFGGERHAEGLRRLGVTQRLKSYEGLTSIREVVELRDKMSTTESGFRKRLRENIDHEEIQDARGRVVSGKAYERRQNRGR